jgi:hypothetical protein
LQLREKDHRHEVSAADADVETAEGVVVVVGVEHHAEVEVVVAEEAIDENGSRRAPMRWLSVDRRGFVALYRFFAVPMGNVCILIILAGWVGLQVEATKDQGADQCHGCYRVNLRTVVQPGRALEISCQLHRQRLNDVKCGLSTLLAFPLRVEFALHHATRRLGAEHQKPAGYHGCRLRLVPDCSIMLPRFRKRNIGVDGS